MEVLLDGEVWVNWLSWLIHEPLSDNAELFIIYETVS